MEEDAEGTLVETVRATGHEHVQATHGSTLEVTTDDYLTPAGDCIVGIEADRAPADFDDAFVTACQDPDARVAIELVADGHSDRIVGRGDSELVLANDRSLVVRTSEYVDDRTVVVGADGAAADLDRALVAALAGGAPLVVRLEVHPGDADR